MKSCLSGVGRGFTEDDIRWKRPKATHVMFCEGGHWHEWENAKFRSHYDSPADCNFNGRIYAVKFEDGSIWDCINGWR